VTCVYFVQETSLALNVVDQPSNQAAATVLLLAQEAEAEDTGADDDVVLDAEIDDDATLEADMEDDTVLDAETDGDCETKLGRPKAREAKTGRVKMASMARKVAVPEGEGRKRCVEEPCSKLPSDLYRCRASKSRRCRRRDGHGLPHWALRNVF
jgi:hypothetical protein